MIILFQITLFTLILLTGLIIWMILQTGGLIMATKQEVLDAIAAEKTLIVTAIQALKDQINNGQSVTPQDLDDIIAAVKGIYDPSAPTV